MYWNYKDQIQDVGYLWWGHKRKVIWEETPIVLVSVLFLKMDGEYMGVHCIILYTSLNI